MGGWGTDEDEEEEKVPCEIEITYIEPASGSVCRRQVYCEPEDWENRYQARLLVSSDLVNSLSEAVGIWQGRFKLIHQRLEQSRMYYYYELGRIRKHAKIVHQFEVDQQKANTQSLLRSDMREISHDSVGGGKILEDNDEQFEIEREVCPVHFFFPESYLDCYTKELLEKAVNSFRDEISLEIANILEKINVVGAGTWWELLAYFLKNGEDPLQLVKGLLTHIEDPAGRREIVNTMTNGLQDLYDALLAQFESLQEENQDMLKRKEEIFRLEHKQLQAMKDLREQMEKNAKLLEEPGFEEPPEEDTSEAVAEAQKEIFETKEASLKDAMAEVRRLRKLMEEWKERAAAECDEEAISEIQAKIKDWTRRTNMAQMRVDQYKETTSAVEERVSIVEDKIAQQKEKMSGLREKLGGISNINPGALKMKRLQREVAELEKEAKKIKLAMGGPNNRIKAMRAQLRELYKKLGWDWDLSDSEDEDGEDQPYWRRRKTAVDGFLPFDQTSFLFGEKDYHLRRTKRLTKTVQASQTSVLIEQMKAKRQGVGGKTIGGDVSKSRDLQLDEQGPVIFGSDEPSRDPVDPVERAISMYRDRLGSLPGPREALLETPCWKRDAEDQETWSRQVNLDRLIQLRESYEVQIQQCIECFADLLPASGDLGDLRARLSQSLTKLRRLPEEHEDSQSQELEQDLKDTCEALQGMIGEAISSGDQVHPISAAMMHSVQFSDLRNLLANVLDSEKQLRAALKFHHGDRHNRGRLSTPVVDGHDTSAIDSQGMSPVTAATSSDGSPRLRGQSVLEDGPLAPHGRGLPSAEELSESLKLPPRLLAQTLGVFGKRQPKKEASRKVDFGFRPDGAGEDSVENWSLFKVSKANTSAGFGDSVSTGMGLTTSSGFIGDSMRKTDNKFRRQRAAADCDFHEYMAQAQQASDPWQTASTPSLLDQAKKKCCPGLPKLINARGTTRSLTASGATARGDLLGTWERSASETRLRVSVGSIASMESKKLAAAAKFGGTAPISGFNRMAATGAPSGFTKW